MAASAHFGQKLVAIGVGDYYVHRSAERHNATCHQLRGGEQLHPLHHGDVDGHVEVVVAGLRVGEVDAVEQHHHLVESAAVDGDITLHVVGAATAEVEAGEQGKQFAYRADRSVLEIVSGEHRRRIRVACKGVGGEHHAYFGQSNGTRLVPALGHSLLAEGQGHNNGTKGNGFVQLPVGDICGQTADGNLAL